MHLHSPDECVCVCEVHVYLHSPSVPDDTSIAATEQSDNSSAMEEMDSADVSLGADSLNLAELEQLSQQLANKGPPQAEAQLR